MEKKPNQHNGRAPHTIEEAFGPGARFDPEPGPARFSGWDVLIWAGLAALAVIVYFLIRALPWPWR
jgi:hypothetical protein